MKKFILAVLLALSAPGAAFALDLVEVPSCPCFFDEAGEFTVGDLIIESDGNVFVDAQVLIGIKNIIWAQLEVESPDGKIHWNGEDRTVAPTDNKFRVFRFRTLRHLNQVGAYIYRLRVNSVGTTKKTAELTSRVQLLVLP
jgi:hypothetical protein